MRWRGAVQRVSGDAGQRRRLIASSAPQAVGKGTIDAACPLQPVASRLPVATSHHGLPRATNRRSFIQAVVMPPACSLRPRRRHKRSARGYRCGLDVTARHHRLARCHQPPVACFLRRRRRLIQAIVLPPLALRDDPWRIAAIHWSSHRPFRLTPRHCPGPPLGQPPHDRPERCGAGPAPRVWRGKVLRRRRIPSGSSRCGRSARRSPPRGWRKSG